MDRDAFEERAAIMEYEGGLSRFEAETLAARAQGKQRWEAIGDVAGRVVEQVRNNRSQVAERAGANNLPIVQRRAEEKARPVFERERNG